MDKDEIAIIVLLSMLQAVRRFGADARAVVFAADVEYALTEILASRESGELYLPKRLTVHSSIERRAMNFGDKDEQLAMALSTIRMLLNYAEKEPAIQGAERITGLYVDSLKLVYDAIGRNRECI